MAGIEKIASKNLDEVNKINTAVLIGLGDALVGEVIDGKFFYAGSTVLKEGTMPTVALAAGSNAYPAGYHVGDGGGLTAVDGDLVAGNIKDGVTIFNVLGTYAGVAITTTELWFNNWTAFTRTDTTAWIAVKNETVPEAAERVVVAAWSMRDSGYNHDRRITYNGVQKVIASGVSGHNTHRWEDDTIGSDAQLVVEIRAISSGNCSGWWGTVAWYLIPV